MCWQCENPDKTRADYLRYVRTVIGKCGWMVQGVEGSRHSPPWAYTIGLTERKLPELVVTGLPLYPAGSLLNCVAEHACHAEPPEHGEQYTLRDGPSIEVVELTEPSAHLVMAVGLYGPDIRARQLVYADDDGFWPWDAKFRRGRGGQPVLGVRCGS
ncbi:DUF4262 domain-containing protein [Amycolatopsis sp. NPDC059021]|uniref:DUF4262 domain-containing protein n=1 Tax=Amycolatopsis sp. NPDC059021 TaxID=3346704 RepID=UPI00366AD20B